ncbi:MAG: flippase-like domain-containing protein [Candidatus Bathyarchaeota archaeon]|nr:flippase-like domain-containing protein [Candidatus Bathyarchaeota archaeon]
MKYLTPRRMLFFMILGSVAFAFYIYFSIGIDRLATVLETLNFSSFLLYYSLSFGTMLLVMILWTASWLVLLRALSMNLGFRKTFLYYMAGDFVDRIVPSPGVVGEVTRAFFVRGDTLSTYGVIAAAGITNRVIVYGVVVGGLSLGTGFLLVTQTVPYFASGLLMAVWFGALALFALLWFVSVKENAARKIVSALMRLLRGLRLKHNFEEMSNRVFRFLSRFNEGFKFFGANPHYLVAPVIFSAVSFSLNFLVYILVFHSLGLGMLPLDFFIVIYFLAGAVQDGAASFSVGGLEILLTNIFILYGIPPATSGVAAVIVRIVTFYFPLIVGYACLQVIGAKNVLNSRTIEEVEEEEQADPTA